MYLALQLIVFRWKQIHFVLYMIKDTFLSDFTIYFYDRNTFTWYVDIMKLWLSQIPQFDLVEKIKDKNKKRTRASLFQSSEDGKQEIFLCGLKDTLPIKRPKSFME